VACLPTKSVNVYSRLSPEYSIVKTARLLMLGYLLNIDQDYVENKRSADQTIAGRQVLLAGRAVADIGVERVPPATLRWVSNMLHDALRDWNTDLRKPFDPARLPPLTRFDAGRILDEIGWLPDDLNAWVLCRRCASEGNRDLMVMKYPVTNAQFARFVAAKNYEAPQWWGGEASDGWRWRARPPKSRGSGPVCEPAFWRHYNLGQGRRGYPVVGVSWHEANAYGAWLNAILHRARRADAELKPQDRALIEHLLERRVVQLRLPTEVEWARVAGSSTSGKERFPWDAQSVRRGANFAAARMRSNTEESELGGTSPVAMYPLGASQPFGLMDLGGNVYEWTASWYGVQRTDYAARGGSWGSGVRSALCSDRTACRPDQSRNDLGFRLVATVES
jgi:formylglycine-generating enzyme required for sulfatase activity